MLFLVEDFSRYELRLEGVLVTCVAGDALDGLAVYEVVVFYAVSGDSGEDRHPEELREGFVEGLGAGGGVGFEAAERRQLHLSPRLGAARTVVCRC